MCKYCGKEHPQIGMTIIPSCVDVKIEQLEDLLRRGLGTSPATLGDWKREVRREVPKLAG